MSGCLVCIVYVSEAMRHSVIDGLKSVVSSSVFHTFHDITYNRTSFYLMAKNNDSVEEEAINLCLAAAKSIDFRDHKGTHPCLGIVDHVYFTSLGPLLKDRAKDAALSFSRKLTDNLRIPTYLYGAASPTRSSLADIRRDFGYFSQKTSGCPTTETVLPRVVRTQDFGPPVSEESLGICCVGAIPLVVNFNMRYDNLPYTLLTKD